MKKMLLFTTILISNCFCIDNIKSSVIIPCCAKHLKYLPDLLEHLSDQTVTPYEVIISASGIKKNEQILISKIKSKQYPFTLKVCTTEKKKFAGPNRNTAILASSGNLIICQDADDIPHPRRIECIEEIYRHNPDVNMIMHTYIGAYTGHELEKGGNLEDYISEYKSIDISNLNKHTILQNLNSHKIFNLRAKIPNFYPKYTINGKLLPCGLHIGACAFPRKTFNFCSYGNEKQGEDLAFAVKVFKKRKAKLYVTQIPLLFYLNLRSSYL